MLLHFRSGCSFIVGKLASAPGGLLRSFNEVFIVEEKNKTTAFCV